MKKTGLCSVFAALCFAFATPAAFAGKLTVAVTARVTQINDPYHLLGDQIVLGQSGTGRYTYETSVPDGNDYSPQDGYYPQFPADASSAFTLGGMVFETDNTVPWWQFQVQVRNSDPYTGQDYLRIDGAPAKPVAALPGIFVWHLVYEFSDYMGSALASDALPTGLPDLSVLPSSHVRITGGRGDGYSNFELVLDIQSVQLGDMTVSPAPGVFVRQQPIVPALLVPAGSQVTAIEGSLNGYDMPAYFASCAQAYNGDPRIVFVCPDLNANLAPGMNRVEWRVRMSDGTAASRVVEWEIVQ
jgi:hypothetical protein